MVLRASGLALLAVCFSLIRLAIDPEARALFKPPALAADEVLLPTAMSWNPPPVWIDARPRAAYARGHIAGARHLSLEEDANFEQLLFAIDAEGAFDGSRPIVVYCSSTACQLSRDMTARLRERYPALKVYVLHGGWR